MKKTILFLLAAGIILMTGCKGQVHRIVKVEYTGPWSGIVSVDSLVNTKNINGTGTLENDYGGTDLLLATVGKADVGAGLTLTASIIESYESGFLSASSSSVKQVTSTSWDSGQVTITYVPTPVK